MEVICKKYYPYEEDARLFLQTFLTGKTYKIVNMLNNSEKWYSIKNENGTIELFSETDFNDYFTTISKIRKDKLQKINLINKWI